MSFLQQSQIIFYTSKKYEDIYMRINQDLNMGYKYIFLLCAALGAKNGRKSPIEKRGREFRASYLNRDEEHLIYSIILNDETVGKNIDAFAEREKQANLKRLVEEYAEGGMDMLVEEVFKEKWNGIKLDESYDNYYVDLLKYTMANLQSVPF